MKNPKRKPLSREEIAAVEVGQTSISTRLASVTTLVFLALVLSVPVMQHLADIRAYLTAERNSPWPQSLEIFDALREARKIPLEQGTLQTILKRNAFLLERISRYEDRLENRSMLTESVLGPGQEVLTRFLGAGNEKAYPGRDGWLYYRPDVDYLTGPSFLDAAVLERKSWAGNSWEPPPQPDPALAIIDFHRQLKAHGVELVLVPAPVKPGIVPAPLAGGTALAVPVHNPAFDEFKLRMEQAGIAVFDPAPVFAQQADPYLVTDTHWTPEGMDAVAEELAGFLLQRYLPAPPVAPLYTRSTEVQTAQGDIASMLKLPQDSTLYADETVTVQPVQPVSAEAASDILLLGDSFANIYSAKEMGWGERAGLAEQLAFHLQRPVGRLLRNDSGAHATREMLRDEWAAGRNPLRGKKVLVWEFAARELALGDWRVFELEPPLKDNAAMFIPEAGENVVVDARVLAVSDIPEPGSVPYRDHVCMVHFKAEDRGRESVAFMLSMKNNKLTEVAGWKPGTRVKVRLGSWDSVFGQYGSINQSELDEFALLDAYGWAEPLGVAEAGRSIPAGLAGYAGILLLLLLTTCRQAKGRLMRIGIGLTGAAWFFAGVVMLGGASSQAQSEKDEPVITTKSPSAVHDASGASFRSWCSNTVAQAELDNQLVVRGEGDWLFLRNEIRHLGAGVFWGNRAAAVSRASKPEYADPLPAILDFHAQLQQAGVELWIVPVPPKAVLYPDKLPGAGLARDDRTDADLQAFYEILKSNGIEVVDMTTPFRAARASGENGVYCRQDSHWGAPAMELMADALASRIETLPWYGQMRQQVFRKKSFELELTGDLWQMLAGEQPQKERLQLNLIESGNGQPVPVDPSSPVLVLGDSHTLVFHGGGDMHAIGAGLIDQLALKIGFPCDLIGVKGSGAGPSRRTLYSKSRKDPAYLRGKKLVIWCFSAREFTEASGIAWRKMPVK